MSKEIPSREASQDQAQRWRRIYARPRLTRIDLSCVEVVHALQAGSSPPSGSSGASGTVAFAAG